VRSIAQDKPVLTLDWSRPSPVTWCGFAVKLAPTSFLMLKALAERSEAVVSHDQLYRAVWGDEIIEPAAVAWHIARIRRACRVSAGGRRLPLLTYPRRGYCLHLPRSSILIVDANQEE